VPNEKLSARAAVHSFGSTVTVTVPASVAADLERMNQITKKVLGKLGCLGCHSGRDIRFVLERDFRFDEKLNMQEFNAEFGV